MSDQRTDNFVDNKTRIEENASQESYHIEAEDSDGSPYKHTRRLVKIKSQLEINKRISSTWNRENQNSPYNQKGSPNSASGLKGQDLTSTIKNQTTGPSRIDFAVMDN